MSGRAARTAGFSRRAFLGSAVAGGVGAAGAVTVGGCAADGLERAAAANGTDPGVHVATEYLPFRGAHQVGVTDATAGTGLQAAFTCTAKDRDELRETFRAISEEVETLMTGRPYPDKDPAYPPVHAGTVGNPAPPSHLSVVVSVGASLFDGRYGLADRRPVDLVPMGFLANDRLDPERTHGDLLLTISSTHEDLDLFALRQIMRRTRGTLALHWMLSGFNRRTAARPGEAGVRNLMGFVDGTANLDVRDRAAMDRFVWVGDDDGEPAWAVGGTYQVVRTIRMFVEFWDRARLSEQEALIGRRKSNGAPLDGSKETDEPDFAGDPDGKVTPLDSHIRLANPRDRATADQRILRKGFSYSRGFDGDGQLDQGLNFVSYQRSISRQFTPIVERLKGEPLEEYLEPQGGGFFYVLPGVSTRGGYLGETLLT